MTREEVRWIALGKMGLLADSVVWDVGPEPVPFPWNVQGIARRER